MNFKMFPALHACSPAKLPNGFVDRLGPIGSRLDKFLLQRKGLLLTTQMLIRGIVIWLAVSVGAARLYAVSVYEPFDYPVGSDLAGRGGWVLTAGASPKVQAGTLAVPGLPAAEGSSLVFGNSQMEVRRFMKNEFAPGEFSGYYWYSLAFKVTALGSLSTNGDFIAAFSSTNTTTEYGGRLYLRKDPLGTPGGYNIGVSRDSGLAADIVWSANVSHTNDTNFVVCRYATPDQGSTDTLLWINPDPSTYGQPSPPAADLTASTGLQLLVTVGEIVLHQASATGGVGAIVVDEIRVEGQWPNVTPVPLTMSAMLANGTDMDLSWDGHQNVFLQQGTNVTQPASWVTLNPYPASGMINNWTITNAVADRVPKFFRVIRWYAQ